MKIAYFLPTSDVGGAETISVNTLKELKNRKHQVSLIINYAYNSALIDIIKKSGLNYVSLKPEWALNRDDRNIVVRVFRYLYCLIDDALLPYRISRFLKKNKFDIIHIHLNMCKFFPRISGKNVFYTCHSDFDRYIHTYGEKWLKRYKILSEAGMITICLNHKMISEIKKCVPNAKVMYLPNWIDVKSFESVSFSKDNLCNELGIPNDVKLIGHIGRLDTVKNHEKSLHVFKKIITEYGKKYFLLIVGDGNKEYLTKLKHLCVDLNIEKNVVFMGYCGNINEIISVLDYSILPSFNEGFPLTALELQVFGVRSVFSYAIPEEVMCNTNCFRLSIEEDDLVWAKCLIGDNDSEYNKDIMLFDKNYVINKLIKMYHQVNSDNNKRE